MFWLNGNAKRRSFKFASATAALLLIGSSSDADAAQTHLMQFVGCVYSWRATFIMRHDENAPAEIAATPENECRSQADSVRQDGINAGMPIVLINACIEDITLMTSDTDQLAVLRDAPACKGLIDAISRQ